MRWRELPRRTTDRIVSTLTFPYSLSRAFLWVYAEAKQNGADTQPQRQLIVESLLELRQTLEQPNDRVTLRWVNEVAEYSVFVSPAMEYKLYFRNDRASIVVHLEMNVTNQQGKKISRLYGPYRVYPRLTEIRMHPTHSEDSRRRRFSQEELTAVAGILSQIESALKEPT